MSLNVYLYAADESKPAGSGIFVREDGETKEISREEWDAKFPGRDPVVASEVNDECVYSRNITHNLGRMAAAAGIYEALWLPEELEATQAAHLVALLRRGLKNLKDDPPAYKQFNPENGWGNYDNLVDFVETYLDACIEYPNATIYVSR